MACRESLGEMPRVMHVEAILWSLLTGDADGRRIFAMNSGSVALLGQYAVEAGLAEGRGDAGADVERGGFSFVLGVSCRRNREVVAERAVGVEEALKQFSGLSGGKPLRAAAVQPRLCRLRRRRSSSG